MIRRSITIGSGQLILLLTVFRVFDLLTYAPAMGEAENGSTVLLAAIPQLMLLALVMLPAGLLIARFEGQDVISCAMSLSKPVGKVLAGVLFVFLIAFAGSTVSSFEHLLTGAVYQESSPWFFIITMVFIGTYAAFLGLEPVARVNTFVFFILVATVVFFAVSVLPKADYVYLQNPLYGGSVPFWRTVVRMCFANFDVVAWLIITPHLNGVPAKSFGWWLLCSAVLFETLIFLLTVGLGDYAATQPFPFLALASVAEFSVFQRLDSLHITLWTFLAFIKVASLLFLAAQCLGYLLPRRLKKTNFIAGGVLCAGAAAFFSSGPEYLGMARAALQSGVPVAVLAVLIPFALLIWSIVAKKRGIQQ